MIPVGKDMIHFGKVLRVVEILIFDRNILSAAVRERQECIRNRYGDGVEKARRHDVPGKRLAGCRINDLLGKRGKIARPFRGRRRGDRYRTRCRAALRILSCEEKEGFVFADGPADGSTELVELERRPGDVEEVARIQVRVAQKFESRSMEFVRTRTS